MKFFLELEKTKRLLKIKKKPWSWFKIQICLHFFCYLSKITITTNFLAFFSFFLKPLPPDLGGKMDADPDPQSWKKIVKFGGPCRLPDAGR